LKLILNLLSCHLLNRYLKHPQLYIKKKENNVLFIDTTTKIIYLGLKALLFLLLIDTLINKFITPA
jgi:hypothetical protein